MEPSLSPLQAAGFLLASAAVLGNDALQTLGTFLVANRGRIGRPLQALYLCALLCAVLLLGWSRGGGEPAWGRLAHYPLPEQVRWPDLLPPVAVLALTRLGMPVSTSFLVLTAFGPANLPALLRQSLLGYGVALLSGALVYGGVAWLLERPGEPPHSRWLVVQWLAGGWLWGQWLIQDLANVYIYLPRQLAPAAMGLSLLMLCAAVCVLVAADGGPIQGRLTGKSPVDDPRSAAVISAVYGLILAGLGAMSTQPLSTTWVFLGLLAGRELALLLRLRQQPPTAVAGQVGGDIARAALGLAVSVAVALAVPLLR
ncbi:MAG: hypothetical protein ACK55X_01005 [Synechococcaceae cyanobacterium]